MTLAILRRLATLLAILLAMTLMIFVLQALVPNDPVRVVIGLAYGAFTLLGPRT